MLRLASLLFAGIVACGCSEPEPMSFVGTWQSLESAEDRVTIQFKPNGAFTRSRWFGKSELRTVGQYRVEPRQIVFDNIVEGIVGAEPTEVQGTIKVPYKFEGTALVFYPGSRREQKFVLVE